MARSHEQPDSIQFGQPPHVGVLALSMLRTIGHLQTQVEELRYAATHDSLTGLLNTAGLEAALGQAPSPQALLYVDGTNQKAVNDTLGHSRGDAVIISTATVITDSVRPQDIVARIDGDEFLAVLIGEPRTDEKPLSPEDVLAKVATRARHRTQDLLTENPDLEEIGFDIAVGGAIWHEGMSVGDLREQAEANMYSIKQAQHRERGQYR